MQGREHLQKNGVPAKSDMFTTRGIGGSKETGNRGLAELLLFKKDCLGFLLGRLPNTLGFSEGTWLNIARVHLADYDAISRKPSSWTSAFTAAQLLYVELCENRVPDNL